MYTKYEIEKLFSKIMDKSYKELSSSTKIYTNVKWTIGYSSPFNGNVYVDLSSINEHSFSKESVIGLLAHELAHQTSYRRRNFFKKWFFLWNYYFSINKRRAIEREADLIAIRRGYGKEILAERKAQTKRLSNDNMKLKVLKKVYLSSKEIEELLKNIKVRSNKLFIFSFH